MIPNQIQAQLQEIYDLNMSHQVEDFLITDRQQANSLENSGFCRDTEEKLLVLEEPGGLSISLYLAEELLSNLDGNNPFIELNNENLNGFCTALEGVSHFTYLTWNASHNRSVSQLELEIQAEVDKFVAIILLARKQRNSIQWADVNKVLFTDCRFDPYLKSEELVRYQAANDFASNFCTQLELRHKRSIDDKITRTELCRFYRKRHLEKLSRCAQTTVTRAP